MVKPEFDGGNGETDRLARLEVVTALLLNAFREKTGEFSRDFRAGLFFKDDFNQEKEVREIFNWYYAENRFGASPGFFNAVKRIETVLHRRENNELAFGKELHTLIYRLHAGLDVEKISDRRFLPIRVYLSDARGRSVAEVERGLWNLLNTFGVEFADEFTSISGTWFKKSIGKTTDRATAEQLRHKLLTLRDTLGAKSPEVLPDGINIKQAEALKKFWVAMRDIDDGVCCVGALLFLKFTTDGRYEVKTKVLSSSEMMAIESNQQLLMEPRTLLKKLSEL